MFSSVYLSYASQQNNPARGDEAQLNNGSVAVSAYFLKILFLQNETKLWLCTTSRKDSLASEKP